MSNTWVVAADSGSARIFDAVSPVGPLEEREDFANPEGRVREQDLASDKPGRSFDSMGHHRHAMGQVESPRERSAASFARLLAGRIAEARARGELDRVVLVAAPEFLGLLRESLDAETRKRVESEYSFNLVAMKPDEIRAHLPERLFSSLASQ